MKQYRSSNKTIKSFIHNKKEFHYVVDEERRYCVNEDGLVLFEADCRGLYYDAYTTNGVYEEVPIEEWFWPENQYKSANKNNDNRLLTKGKNLSWIIEDGILQKTYLDAAFWNHSIFIKKEFVAVDKCEWFPLQKKEKEPMSILFEDVYCNIPTLEVQNLLLKILMEKGFVGHCEKSLYSTMIIYKDGHIAGNYGKDNGSGHKKISLEDAFELTLKEKLKVEGHEVEFQKVSGDLKVKIGCVTVDKGDMERLSRTIEGKFQVNEGLNVTVDHDKKMVLSEKGNITFDEFRKIFKKFKEKDKE